MSDGVPQAELGIFPNGIKPLSHQVSGHVFKDKNKLGFLEGEDGLVLKPCQSGERGIREQLFYQQIFEAGSNDSTLVPLKHLLPNYFGTWTSPLFPDVTFLKLKDITKSYKKPCIIDVKVGPRTWDPEATAEKIASEKKKFPPVARVGFSIGGVRVYDKETDEYTFTSKQYLRSLTAEEVLTKGLSTFFNVRSCHFHRCTVVSVLGQLRQVKLWFEAQTRFHFYASSLLMVYEGDREVAPSSCGACQRSSWGQGHSARSGPGRSEVTVETSDSVNAKPLTCLSDGCCCENGVCSEEISCETLVSSAKSRTGSLPCQDAPTSHPLSDDKHGQNTDQGATKLTGDPSASPCGLHNTHVPEIEGLDRTFADVRMIDFTHVFPADNTRDQNYLFGLNSLIRHLEVLLE